MKILIPALSKEIQNRLKVAVPEAEFVVAGNLEEAISLVGDVEGCFDYCSDKLLKAAPKLRWIQVRSAGVEKLPFENLKRHGITITNAQEIYGTHLADHNMALILAFSRQLPFLFRAQQKGVWESRKNYPPGELVGETILVVGLGGTGLETARRAAGFGMRVLATRRHMDRPKPDFVDELHEPKKLHELLPGADWVAVCVPVTKDTRDMFHDAEFDLMKPTSYIVCVTRGGIINTEALLRALDEEKIKGAGLDVTDPEPLPPGHPLWTRQNVIITPHASGHSPHSDQRLMDLFCENLIRFTKDRPLKHIVDLDLEY